MSIKKNSTFEKSIETYFSITLIIVLLLFLFIKSNQSKVKKAINAENYNGEAIGLTTRFKKADKHNYHLRYYFYYNNERVLGKVNGNDLNSSVLNKYYQIKFNENNPVENEIILENEIKPDSTILIKSGFKHKRNYTHNISTNTYEENWKWE